MYTLSVLYGGLIGGKEREAIFFAGLDNEL
jgi:hypothetical protein